MKPTRSLRNSVYLLVESLKSRAQVAKRQQVLDVAQANKMQKTLHHLGLFDTGPLQTDDSLPLCYHMAYFTPQLAEHELGADGSDTTFSPGTPFTRRMWAGGHLTWDHDNPLRLGQTIEEITSLDRVESKQTREKKSMIVITGRKEYRNENGLALTDLRSWLFREPQVANPEQEPSAAPSRTSREGTRFATVKASEITLFRYSALTFNSHKIHYDRQWCREMENQRDLVVHGPLNITLIANTWMAIFGSQPQTLAYRALSPCFVNEEYNLMHDDKSIWFEGQAGNVIMSAHARGGSN